jgi:CheY-like chemotaxis protein
VSGHILVVDDEPAIRLLIRATLEEEGYEIAEAGSGDEALRLAHETHPDAILMDVAIPRISGLDVCRTLRASSLTASIPVLLLTGLDGTEELAVDAGAQGCIAKPFSPAHLSARLAQELQA